MRLHEVAPRLCLARDQILAERAAASVAHSKYLSDKLRAESKLAHRELQLVRAQATGDGRYIMRRQDKLERARQDLDRVKRRAA